MRVKCENCGDTESYEMLVPDGWIYIPAHEALAGKYWNKWVCCLRCYVDLFPKNSPEYKIEKQNLIKKLYAAINQRFTGIE